jgi:glycosyltransferase domain-containing protein
MTSRVTLIIPTMNRQKLLFRLLTYLTRVGFSGDILIADSTPRDGFEAISERIAEFEGCLSIKHFHLPDLAFASAIRAVSKYVCTPYAAVIPDDDFLIPSGLKKCAEFLDHNNGFVAVHGLGVVIGSEDEDSEEIKSAGSYPLPVLLDEQASDRVINLLSDYSVTLFSLHRSDIWMKGFDATPSAKEQPLCCDRALSDEMLNSVLTAAYGRVAQIDCLYLIRQDHNARNFLLTWYQWLTSEKWQPSCIWFRDKVAAAICEVDGTSMQRAQESVDSGLARYLQKTMGLVKSKGLQTKILEKFKGCMPNVGLAVLRRLRPRFVSGYISLEGLLDPASPYHLDFMQVYNLVTENNCKSKARLRDGL